MAGVSLFPPEHSGGTPEPDDVGRGLLSRQEFIERSAIYGGAFVELAPDQQDAVLIAIEAGDAAAWPAEGGSAPEFFETVRTHTIIGFLADPKYGGNRDHAGWKVVGYPGPRHPAGGYTPEQMVGLQPIRPIWGEEH